MTVFVDVRGAINTLTALLALPRGETDIALGGVAMGFLDARRGPARV